MVETSSLEKAHDGKTTTSSATRTVRLTPQGEVPESISTTAGSRTLQLNVTQTGITYKTTTEKGEPIEGTLESSDKLGHLKLKINGKAIDIPADPEEASKLLKKKFPLEQLAGLDVALKETTAPQLAYRLWKQSIPGVAFRTGAHDVFNFLDTHGVIYDTAFFVFDEYGRLSSVYDKLNSGSENIPYAEADGVVPGLAGQLANSIGLVGVGIDAWDTLYKFKRREFFKATVKSASIVERLIEFGGDATGKFGVATRFGRGIRAGRAVVEAVDGAYNIAHGDTKFDRLRGGASMASAGVRVGLALTVGAGPLAPALFGALAITEAANLLLNVADSRYVAPMSNVFAPTPAAAAPVAEEDRQRLEEERRLAIKKTQKMTADEISAAQLHVVDLGQKFTGSNIKFHAEDGSDPAHKFTFKPFNPASTNFEKDVMGNSIRARGGEASAQPVPQSLTLPDGQVLDGYVKPHVKGDDLTGDPTKWSPGVIDSVLADAPWAEFLGNYDLKLDQYKVIKVGEKDKDARGEGTAAAQSDTKDERPTVAVNRDWDTVMSDYQQQDHLDRYKAFKTGIVAKGWLPAAPPAQNLLYEAYVKGRLDINFAPMFEAIERIQAIPDADIAADMKPFLDKTFAKGKTFGPYKSPNELVAAVLDRKAHLKENFERFVQDLKDERAGLAADKARFIPTMRELRTWLRDSWMHLGEWFVESPLLKKLNQHTQHKEAKKLGIRMWDS